MKFGIVVFPGSNCDEDCHHVAKDLLGCEADYIWHHDTDLKGADVVILPGGFAYGDYLRAGALARFSPVMDSVAKFAAQGGPVLGICNGFQVLLEAGLLPGAMQINRGLRYVCRDVHMRVENDATPFTSLYPKGSVVKMPIGHMEGNYTAPPDVLDSGGTPILKVDGHDGEILIPFAEAFLRKVDLGQRRIEMALPEGLRDLNK